jgi:CRP-like cAMP-binding protein
MSAQPATHEPFTAARTATDPFEQRLSHYVALTDSERASLASITGRRRTLKAGQVLVEEGQPSDEMYVLRRGWVNSSMTLGDGGRQIVRFFTSGDLINGTCLAWTRTAATLTAATEAEVSPLPRRALTTLFETQPRLAALLHGLVTVETVVLSDRVASLGRTDGRARIATLLLELWSRQRVVDREVDTSFELFLSQVQIADIVGLTKIHVNRLLKEMEGDGLISRSGRRQLTLVDPKRLAALTGFVDRHADLATDWLPSPR